MDFRSKSHFEFLGLAESYQLDLAQLQQAYLRLQAAVHPDRFARAGGAEHRIAMQLATQANEANRTLSDPTRRAAYLCELHGAPIQAETNTSMSHTFLIEQMGWRESLEEARETKDAVALAGLDRFDRVQLAGVSVPIAVGNISTSAPCNIIARAVSGYH